MKPIDPRIDALTDGQTVTARWGRAGREAPEWGKWRKVKLYVQRTTQAYKGVPAGTICTIALRDVNWAEYDPRGYDAQVTGDTLELLAEDYYCEIKLPEVTNGSNPM